MTNLMLIVKDLDESAKVRKTEDGLYSVYDAIGLCGATHPAQALSRLDKAYPEMKFAQICANFKFTGQGQRLTPVADKATLFQIIGLLPGKLGKAYRAAAAAELVVRYLEADVSLAVSIAQRTPNPEALQPIAEVAIARSKDPEWLDRIAALTARTKADLDSAGIPHGRLEAPLDGKQYEKDMKGDGRDLFHFAPEVDAKFMRQLGGHAWRIDRDTPNYQDYCEWDRFYQKDGLPLEEAIEALAIIQKNR